VEFALATLNALPFVARPAVETCDAGLHTGPFTQPFSRDPSCELAATNPLRITWPMDPSTTTSPALSVAIAVLAVLLGLTGFGVYTAFGPPSKGLTDPFDDHED
jgi:PsbN protein